MINKIFFDAWNGTGVLIPFDTGNTFKNGRTGKILNSYEFEIEYSSYRVPYLVYLEEREKVGRSNVDNIHKDFIKIDSVDLVANIVEGNLNNNQTQKNESIMSERIKSNPAQAKRHLNSLRR